MKFEDVIMDYDEELQGVQGIVKYGPYELSIVSHKYSYGGDKLYEIGVFGENGMTELPGITSSVASVKGYLTEDEVNAIMTKMMTITRESGKNI